MNPLLQLMHDTMSPVSRIKAANELLQNPNTKDSDKATLHEIIKTSADKLNEVLDAYYSKQKNTADGK